MEEHIAGALVGLPLGDQAAEALVEELLVDDNIAVRHNEGVIEMGPSGELTAAGVGGEEKATAGKSREMGLRRGRRAGWARAAHVIAFLV